MDMDSTESNFSSKLQLRLRDITYKVEHSSVDRETIYKLRYKAYRRAKLIEASPTMMFRDEYDEFKNCLVFGLYVDEVLVSSIRVHIMSADNPKGMALDVYPDIVTQMVFEEGHVVVDPSRFVVDPDLAGEFPEMPYVTLRAAVMASEHYNARYCLVTARRPHMAFYRRVFRAEILSEPRMYPMLSEPFSLMRVDLARVRDTVATNYPFFVSDNAEREKIFGSNLPVVEEMPVLNLQLNG